MTRRKDNGDTLPDDGLLFVERGRYDRLKPSLDFIPGMLHDTTVAIIYGPPGSGKTFFALHLLCSSALARPLFGGEIERRHALYVGLEGEANIKARIQAWCVANKVDSNPIDYALGSFSLANDADVESLIEHMQERQIQFVVIDTLSIAMAGLDEISGQHMSHVIEKLHKIKRETGACVAALAHTGKNEKAGIRGHSSQLGNVDTTIEIVYQNKEIVREGNKTRVVEQEVTLATPRFAVVRKQRDGESNTRWRFALALKETPLQDARGRPVASPAVDECESFRDLEDSRAEAKARHLSKREREATDILARLVAKHERGRLGRPTLPEFRDELRRNGWGPEHPASWRSAFRQLRAKLDTDSNDAVVSMS